MLFYVSFISPLPLIVEKKRLFTPEVINCDIMLIGKTTEINDKKPTVCSAFYMNFTFPLNSGLCYALSRQKVINTYKIYIRRSSTPWWKAFTSQPLYIRWALLFSLSFLCTFKEEKDLIVYFNKLTWRHKQKESLSEGLKFPCMLDT